MDDFTHFFPLIMVFILCGSAHEFCHAWSAYRLGDTTSRDLGRLTMNPFAHVEIMGTVIVPILTYMLMQLPFGWMKPVPVSPSAFKRPQRDMLLVALAGPYANLFLAFAGFFVLLFFSDPSQGVQPSVIELWIRINLLLAYLNLLPIPPLDGSAIVDYLFRKKGWSYKSQGYLGLFFFMFLFLIGFRLLGLGVMYTFGFVCLFPWVAPVVLGMLIAAGIAFFALTGRKNKTKKKRHNVQSEFSTLYDQAQSVGRKLAAGEELSHAERVWIEKLRKQSGDGNDLCASLSFHKKNDFCKQCPNFRRCAVRMVDEMSEAAKPMPK
ncbi:MAG: site-2 protease family protein [Planctomycetota bacterium]